MRESPPSASDAFRKATTLASLETVYADRIEHSSVRGRDGQRPEALRFRWEETARYMRDQMRAGTYRFSPYRMVVKDKGPGRLPRVLCVPSARDRIVLRALVNALAIALPELRRERAQVMIGRFRKARASGDYAAFVRVDLQSFYDTIDHEILMAALSRRVRAGAVRRLVRRAIETPYGSRGQARPDAPNKRGVPQGVAISSILGELYLNDFDAAFAERDGLAYFRYVDDILVLCPTGQAESLFDEMRSRLTAIELKPHPIEPGSKSLVGKLDDDFDFLGYRFHDGLVGVRKSSVRRIEDSIVRIVTNYRYALAGQPKGGHSHDSWPAACERVLVWRLNLLVTGCVFEGNRRGWLPYFLRIDELTLLKKLDALIAGQLDRLSWPQLPRVKSFMRAYWSWKSERLPHRFRYIPNFDALDVSELRHMLVVYFFDSERLVAPLSDNQVRERFSRRMNKIVKELERDIGANS